MRFGTDGVRGVANAALTGEFAMALGRATARVLGGSTFLIGRDTRRSGTLLESAFAAGLCAEGVSVELLGVVPTPAVAALCADDGVAGAVISASHNPFPDNGIKIFAAGGRKLADAVQAEIERAVDSILAGDGAATPLTGASVGTVGVRSDATQRYLDHLHRSVPASDFDGARVVLDCGHGASYQVASRAFEARGATVIVINADPDGTNINAGCGSTHPDVLVAAVRDAGADLGFAFDGDADRVVAVGSDGTVIDGDELIAMNAADLRDRGELAEDTVVVTVMTNLGFRQAMGRAGIVVVDTAVGDRYVLEALDAGGFVLGGEQSGHIIFRDVATTGDGVLAALRTTELVRRSGRTIEALAASSMTRLPQTLVNVAISQPMPDVTERIAEALGAAAALLGTSGRVLVRPSGTEPVVRVMVEASDVDEATAVGRSLASAVETADLSRG